MHRMQSHLRRCEWLEDTYASATWRQSISVRRRASLCCSLTNCRCNICGHKGRQRVMLMKHILHKHPDTDKYSFKVNGDFNSISNKQLVSLFVSTPIDRSKNVHMSNSTSLTITCTRHKCTLRLDYGDASPFIEQ